ncbi:MAG: hypothetical protein ACR2PG_24045 [Hyphomicrobiaceae bacterium]
MRTPTRIERNRLSVHRGADDSTILRPAANERANRLGLLEGWRRGPNRQQMCIDAVGVARDLLNYKGFAIYARD